jgi:hypothetical protein
MGMTDHQADRRKSNRVNANLKLEVTLPRPDGSREISTLETINISSSGIYFRSDHFIEPMTKLAMEIEVSVPLAGNPGQTELAPIPCEGLVVRTQPDAPDEKCSSYEVAVFFTHIDAIGSANLEKHIALLIDDLG